MLKEKNYRAIKTTAPCRIDLVTRQRRIGSCQLRTLFPLGNRAIFIGQRGQWITEAAWTCWRTDKPRKLRVGQHEYNVVCRSRNWSVRNKMFCVFLQVKLNQVEGKLRETHHSLYNLPCDSSIATSNASSLAGAIQCFLI